MSLSQIAKCVRVVVPNRWPAWRGSVWRCRNLCSGATSGTCTQSSLRRGMAEAGQGFTFGLSIEVNCRRRSAAPTMRIERYSWLGRRAEDFESAVDFFANTLDLPLKGRTEDSG